MKRYLLCALCCSLFQLMAWTQTADLSIQRQTLGNDGGSYLIEFGSKKLRIQQSIGQRSIIGTHSNDAFTLRQGFIQPNIQSVVATTDQPLRITLFPNPFADEFQLRFDEVVVGIVQLWIYDLNGRLVDAQSFDAVTQQQIRFTTLSQGVYVVHIQADNRQYNGRIQKL